MNTHNYTKTMTHILKASLRLILAGMMTILVLTGCHDTSKNAQPLVVVRQHVRFGSYNSQDIAVDVPIKGPRPLLDSLKVFLNAEVYRVFESLAFESGNATTFTPKDVYTNDMSRLLDSYADTYSGHIGKISEWDWPSGFSLFLVAQTESFVTYGLEFYRGRGSSMCCHTFSKKDGHKIGEIITEENLVKFLNDHPSVEHPFFDFQIYGEEPSQWKFFEVGLLEDGALCINECWQNHYLASKFSYKKLLPYLSSEAQELINTRGETKFLYEDCSLGEPIGKVKTFDGETICLMTRLPLWDGFGTFSYLGEAFEKDKAYTLTAYTMKKGDYVRNDNVFPTPRLKFEFPNGAWSGPIMEDNEYYLFDAKNKLLLAPYKKEEFVVDFLTYRFDGKRFVVMGDDITNKLTVEAGDNLLIGCSNEQLDYRVVKNHSERAVQVSNDRRICCHGDLVIPELVADYDGTKYTVVGTGSWTFHNYSEITSVKLPETMEYIGEGAFAGCTAMETINIPPSVNSIGNMAFCNCESLKRLILGEGVTKLMAYVFAGCRSLETIRLPERVTYIGPAAFLNCDSLKSITIPNTVECVYEDAFDGCNKLKINGVKKDEWFKANKAKILKRL